MSYFSLGVAFNTFKQVNNLSWFRDTKGTFQASDFSSIGHPFGTTGIQGLISTQEFQGRTYGCGGFTDNWMMTEQFGTYRLGMIAPDSIPVIALGAGIETQIPFVSFYDNNTGERSPLSAAGASVTGSVPRTWSNLPTVEIGNTLSIPGTTTANATTAIVGVATGFGTLRVGDQIALSTAPTVFARILTITDDLHMTVDLPLGAGGAQTIVCLAQPRATHIELWVSVNGALPRLAVRRTLGVTTAVESIATLALGIAFTVPFTQFPRCSFNALYHSRLVMAGDPNNPGTLYLSDVALPERYVLLSFSTLNGESITGLRSIRDSLLVFTSQNTYILRGYTQDDLVLAIADYDLGALSHWAVDVIYGHAWVCNEQGVFLWDGQYHPVLEDRQTEWTLDYKANESAFQSGFCYHNPTDFTFSFVIPQLVQKYVSSIDAFYTPEVIPDFIPETTIAWVADYRGALPETSGQYGQPNWSFDIMAATWTSVARMATTYSGRGNITAGFCDGYIYQMDPLNGSDFGDAYNKALYVRFPHSFFGDPGGDLDEGKRFIRSWTYVESENNNWTVQFLGGDEHVYQQGTANQVPPQADNVRWWWKNDVPASFATITVVSSGDVYGFVPMEVHLHNLENVAGRGLTVTIHAIAPVGMKIKGFGGIYGPGPASRTTYLISGS